ncbi:hypothetical protein NPIL_57621 [Nephila pilipes]|uniref:Uncharacterized protein n=1 Tax=Nephila pilipes TaxID=299642 RepID=A0A8X6IGV0_NEPPI|nr:hypothetical protein NPIL_57621 [Nephila pilipes]
MDNSDLLHHVWARIIPDHLIELNFLSKCLEEGKNRMFLLEVLLDLLEDLPSGLRLFIMSIINSRRSTIELQLILVRGITISESYFFKPMDRAQRFCILITTVAQSVVS